MKTDFKIGLKHWTGTVIVAVLAGFVIFGLLRGQEILNDFLKSEPTDANLKRGELLVLIPSLALTPPAKPLLPSPKLTLKPTPLEAARARSVSLPLTGPTPKPLPPLMPTVSPSSLPTLKPMSSPTPVSTPTPILTPTFSPTPTPFYESTPSPMPSQTPMPAPVSTSSSQATLTPSPTPTPLPSVAAVVIVINEIAWMGTKADATDEWIELYNPNAFVVDITGWTVKAFKIKNGVLAVDTPDITFPDKTIGAFGYFLLERTSDNTVFNILADFIYTGALDNSGEILELRDNTGQLRDKVGHLTEDGQVITWYAGHNTSKSTMERINPSNPGNESSNWQTNNGITKNGLDAEANPINGTPKAKNSSQVY